MSDDFDGGDLGGDEWDDLVDDLRDLFAAGSDMDPSDSLAMDFLAELRESMGEDAMYDAILELAAESGVDAHDLYTQAMYA